MGADERYTAALEAAIEEVDELLEQVGERKRFANTLALKAGRDPVYDDVEAPTTKGTVTIRSDHFANHSAASPAVREYLRLRGMKAGSASVDMIYDALERGGYPFAGTEAEAKNNLRISLGKDKEVRRISNGTYGLWSWYPNADRAREEGGGGGRKGKKDEKDASAPKEPAASTTPNDDFDEKEDAPV